jgi:uncharacterized protein YegP (UPF0339 family)
MYAIMNPIQSQYVIEVWRGIDGKFYFHVVHRNGRIICTSEGYTRKSRAALAAQRMSLDLINAPFTYIEKP